MAETRQSMTLLIDHAEQRKYLRIPFTVEADVEKLTVAYSYERHRLSALGEGRTARREVNIIDLALEDPGLNLVGASGSERREISIHENYATPGYRPAKLIPGAWQLVLGAYLIEEHGCTVEISITQQTKEDVLLRGDCHTHTQHSDGWYTVEEVVARARQDRLDYLFVTDHNSMSSNEGLCSTPDLTVLPGVEITYYDGHYNLFGLPRPVKTYTANTREEVLSIMGEGRDKGALVSINHPMCNNCGWKFGFGPDVPADLVEIWNGPFTAINAAGVALWHEQLCQGRKWPAIGGSDCHHVELFRNFATPATFLYSRSRSGSDILAAMKQGHAFIGMDANAPRIHMALGEARMGDSYRPAPGQPVEKLKLSLQGLQKDDELRLYDQRGLLLSDKPGACYQYEREHRPEGSRFLRLEVWRNLQNLGPTLASISNPIYLDS